MPFATAHPPAGRPSSGEAPGRSSLEGPANGRPSAWHRHPSTAASGTPPSACDPDLARRAFAGGNVLRQTSCGRVTCLRKTRHVEPVFVFDDPPTVLAVYASLEEAGESLESLDAVEDQVAFTATGQVVEVAATGDLFARLEPTGRHDLAWLTALLRRAVGPAHLADDPIAYAEEWWRVDDIEAGRLPFLPTFVSRRRSRKRS